MWSVLASPLKCFLTKDQPPTWTLPTSTPAAPVTLAAADSIYNKPSNPDTLHYSFTRLVPNSLHLRRQLANLRSDSSYSRRPAHEHVVNFSADKDVKKKEGQDPGRIPTEESGGANLKEQDTASKGEAAVICLHPQVAARSSPADASPARSASLILQTDAAIDFDGGPRSPALPLVSTIRH